MLASTVRQDIFETTGCTASAGIAGNMLMARLATRTAKPDGQCSIPPERDTLQKDFGIKTGEMLWNHSRGIDNRLVGVIQETKSIGAEVNWGVRFRDLKDEVLRLQGCAMQGRSFTLKIKKRRKDAQEPVKYMGCGDCENLSYSVTVPVATDDAEVLQRITKQLFGLFTLDVKEFRGIGLQVSKLESVDASKQGLGKSSLKSWLKSAKANTEEQSNIYSVDDGDRVHSDCEDRGTDQSVGPLCEKSLGIRTAVDNHRSSGETSVNQVQKRGVGDIFNDMRLRDEIGPEPMHTVAEKHALPSFVGGFCDVVVSTSDVMPASLSQVDPLVLQELPQELSVDLLEQLPAHRRSDLPSIAASDPLAGIPGESIGMGDRNHSTSDDPAFNKLWIGNPPRWVEEFKASKCMILNVLAKIYDKSGSSGNLSVILRSTIMECHHPLDSSSDSWIQAVYSFSELLRQYVTLKIDSDIEEIYLCFRLLRRFKTKSKFFL